MVVSFLYFTFLFFPVSVFCFVLLFNLFVLDETIQSGINKVCYLFFVCVCVCVCNSGSQQLLRAPWERKVCTGHSEYWSL